ncbi:AEC family transporter [Euzebya tangerina]|uniref:AEC family transporter n=1 Tax=Euzebya tangerina TaxID=591198 RepID=UPI000E320DB4|nr:AEC family transporter [Euzebya tangerina]
MTGLVSIVVDILGPVFALIGLGAVAGRRLHVPPAPLATMAYWIIGPAFMFDVLASADLGGDVLVRMVGALLLGLIAAGLTAWVAATSSGADRRAAVLTTSVYGNAGNYGLAVVVFTFGEQAAAFAAIGLVVVNTVGVIVGVASAHSGLASVRRALTSPLTLAIPPAALVNALDLDLPTIADRAIGLLAGALIPVMLLTLGIQLQGMTRPRLDADILTAVGTKLLVQPAVAAGAAVVVGLSGAPLGAVVLMAAMPAAVFTVVLSIEQDTMPDLTSAIVLVGTLASLLTLPGIIALVR